MPGATTLVISASDPTRLVAGATFGVIVGRDGGFEWICEQAIQVSGEADPPIAITEDGTFVLLPPTGSALISRDGGCTWSEAPEPLSGTRTIDCASDPSAPARVVVVSSTVASIDDQGRVEYANAVFETQDNARTWTELAVLGADFRAETIEVAPSDSERLYVSGASSDDPLLGIIERSEDGGATWQRETLGLPQGSGSVFVSAVHPNDPDHLWIRVPARGDVFGLFPASLLASDDKGRSWTVLASTTRAMFGFALSPDGTELAYGGPFDGVFVGPADGTSFAKTNDVGVRCLRWNQMGLYACGSQPGGPFSLGLSDDRGASFIPLYDAADTCPRACADGAAFRAACEPGWRALAPVIQASGEACAVDWAAATDAGAAGAAGNADSGSAGSGGAGGSPVPDGGASGGTDGTRTDAGVAEEEGAESGGCGCRAARGGRGANGWLGAAFAAFGVGMARYSRAWSCLRFRRGRRRKRPQSESHSGRAGSSTQR